MSQEIIWCPTHRFLRNPAEEDLSSNNQLPAVGQEQNAGLASFIEPEGGAIVHVCREHPSRSAQRMKKCLGFCCLVQPPE